MTEWCSCLLLPALLLSGQAVCADLPQLGETSTADDASSGSGKEMSLKEIASKLDNPLSDLWLLWMQNDRMRFNGDASRKSRTIDVKYLEPVISIPVTRQWNLVNRPVITRIDAQVPDINLPSDLGNGLGGTPGGGDFGSSSLVDLAETVLNNADWDNESEWGDLIFLSMLAPQEPPRVGNGKFVWGAGVTTMFPTASDDLFGTEKYSAGPAGLALYMGPKWKVGALGQQWWSFAGNGDRDRVNRMNIQYFWLYDLPNLWQIGASPNITANWEADSDNRWTVPIGIGINKTVRIGRLPVRFGVELHKTVIQPDTFGMDWNLRFVMIPVIPNLVEMAQGRLQLPE